MRSQPKPTRHRPEAEILARQGMRLPSVVLNHLKSAGIYCQPTISIEHQQLRRRYVLRGVECGGAVAALGAYSSFVDECGQALRWLQRVDSIAVNSVHAVVIAPILVRLEMVRIERTYDVLITRHSLSKSENGARPKIESAILFYGRRGTIEMELWGKDAAFRGAVSPVFYTRSGEIAVLPKHFERAIVQLTAAVCCVSCCHCHLLAPELAAEEERVSTERCDHVLLGH
jgi:hypothetical protein